VLPLFEFGFWPEARTAAYWKLAVKAAAWLAPRFSRARIRLCYSEVALAWQSRYFWSAYLPRRRGEGAPTVSRATAATFVVFFQIVRLILIAVLLPVILVIGLPVCAIVGGGRLGLRAAKAIVRGERPIGERPFRGLIRATIATARRLADPGFLLGRIEAAASWFSQGGQPPAHQAAAFGRDARNMLKRLAPGPEDIIFFPTISEHDLRGLAEELDRTRERLEAGWHFLFRRNIYSGRRAAYAAQDAGLEELRLVFERVRRSVLAGRCYFYTDTEELTEQYDRLGIMRFRTLPVPHTYSAADRIAHSGPLRLTYLGDARTEKGFDQLPHLASRLEADYLATKRAKLVLQCNYNIPGGEPRVALARGELESMPGEYVEFYRRPLTSEEYRDLLLRADVNLLCYDAENYYARSSGVLVESLAVGIPVIVPGGCWLSRQFCARQLEYIDEVRPEMTSLWAKSLTELRWTGTARQDNSPRQLIRVHGDGGPSVALDVPHGATHLVVSGVIETGSREALVCVVDVGWDDQPVLGGSRRFRLEAPRGSDRCAILTEIRPNVPRVSLSLRTGQASENTWFRTVEIEFLRAPAGRSIPKGVIGLSYEMVTEIPALVADLVDHYAHYQRTATEFSKSWREYHNPDRLLRDMETMAGISRTGGPFRGAQTERVAV